MTTLDPVDPETWARRILDRPDQVHVADPEKLRGLLDEIRGLRARLGEYQREWLGIRHDTFTEPAFPCTSQCEQPCCARCLGVES